VAVSLPGDVADLAGDKVFFVPSTLGKNASWLFYGFGIVAGGYVLGWEDELLTEIGRATIGFTSRRTARRINRLKGIVANIPPAYDTPTPDFLTLSRL
jgi:hypothetical protein